MNITLPKQTEPISFSQKIKTETEELHLSLEAQPLFASLMLPTVDVQLYRNYLLLMKSLWIFCEVSIFPHCKGCLSDWAPISGRQLIEADLLRIQSNSAFKSEPVPFSLPSSVISTPAAIGFLYVMEGSKLGGKFIFKHIHQQLGYDELEGASYLANYGTNTGQHWKTFLAAVSKYVEENGIASEVIDGAKQAFISIAGFIEANGEAYES